MVTVVDSGTLTADDLALDGSGGPSFSDLSAAASAAGFTIPNPGNATSAQTDPSIWQTQLNNFQACMNALDQAAQSAQAAIAANIDPQLTADLQSMLDDFNAKATVFSYTAQALNVGVQVINSAGGSLAPLNIPQTLGIAPLVLIPIAAIAAFAIAATLINWGNTWIAGYNNRMQVAQDLAAGATPDQLVALQTAQAQAQAAQVAASNPLSAVSSLFSGSSLVTWLVLGGAVWFLFKKYGHHLNLGHSSGESEDDEGEG